MASFPMNHGVTNPTFTSKEIIKLFATMKKEKKITSYFSTKKIKFKGQFYFIFAFLIFVVAVKDN
jgi:hypothetical protein